jgi:predicted acetyltransferase
MPKSSTPPFVELARPHLRFKNSFLEALAEYQAENRYMDLDLNHLQKHFEGYVEGLLAQEFTRSSTRVPDTIYWGIDKMGHFIGRISLRHELNEFLSRAGGHIGYDVRPSMRGRGYASEMLKLCLQTPKAKEISNLLLTCDEDNEASKAVILKNGGTLGGRFEGEEIAGMDEEQARVARRPKLQFWIKS